ncbi:MAG: FG-GAP-like repeat-containing protein [Acidobacteria bacterium]|nr:FG-GAP-like repeat-containing protein [Acidobacteriota bacterium]
MRYISNVHAADAGAVSQRGQRARCPRLILFLVLCVCATWSPDTSLAAGCATPVYAPPTFYPADAVRSIAPGDFDGDGVLDLAVLTISGNNTANLPGKISLYYGDGAGGISSMTTLGGGWGNDPNSIAVGDFDGDGRADLVIDNGRSEQTHASVFLSADLFQREIPLQWTGPRPSSSAFPISAFHVTAADVNADGKSDVVALVAQSREVLIALGGAAGNFTNFKIFNSGGSRPNDVVAGDFNGDGKLDLAVANGRGFNDRGKVAILPGDGAGNFGTATTYNAFNPISIVSGDFNGDNKPDLAMTVEGGGPAIDGWPSTVSVMLGNSAGTFAAPSFYTTKSFSLAPITAADFNADGKLDIAVHQDIVRILQGDGTGNFSLSPSFGGGGFMLAPDFDGDGKADLVGGAVSVSLNDCGATTPRLSFGQWEYSLSEGGTTVNTLTLTVNRSGPLAGTLAVDYATSDGKEINKAVSPADYKATSGTLSFADGEASKAFIIEINHDSIYEWDERFLVTLSNPTRSAVLAAGGVTSVRITSGDQPSQFSVNNTTITEGQDHVTVTVTRTDDLSRVASLEYRTADDDTFAVGCSDATGNSGDAYARCDFATTFGRLEFAVGELRKSFTIPIINDGHVEGTETFAVVLTHSLDQNSTRYTGTVTIQDNDAAGAANPIFTTPFFVRQHYFDFLSREPEADEPWSKILNRCPNVNDDSSCDRISVSQSFFRSPEFNLKGLYVFRLYKVAFNRLPEYKEFIEDMSFAAGATEAEVYARKAQLASAFTMREEFRTAFPLQSNSTIASALLGRYQLTQITTPDPAHPDGTAKVTLTQQDLINRLNTNALTRSQVLRAVADSDEVKEREFNNAFVAMQYYGYLRRKPEPAGYEAWLGVLKRGDIRTMVNGFMNSAEYKLRFGSL